MAESSGNRQQGLCAFAPACVAVAVLVLTACGSSPSTGSSSGPGASRSVSAVPLPSKPATGKQFYISIGDSYAAGYQPETAGAPGRTTTNGFAYQLPAMLDSRGYHLTLVNFGCAGATTTSLLTVKGCPAILLGPGAPSYPTMSQADAAISFISAHRADVGLVTVSISGNDVTSCGRQPRGNFATCLTQALAKAKANLSTFLPKLRSAAGPNVPIIGLTYPDVLLGVYVSPKASQRPLAALSATVFKTLINPALKARYEAVQGIFVDVTAASGAYTPFSQTTSLPPYGTIPVAVAKVCQLTFYCQLRNIHPRTVGYTLIANLIARALPKR
jgi:lysophospholipase L1-like esterase